jgi:nicotinamide-nucleotide amidase
MEDKLKASVRTLLKRDWTIAFAESASAGWLAYKFSTVPDSGQVLLGSLVCYHECLKKGLLGIPPALIERHTAESAEVTKAMAHALKKITGAELCVALTGLTTPGGSETPEKPVGTIFLHFIFPGDETAKRFEFKGNPEQILAGALIAVCDAIINK